MNKQDIDKAASALVGAKNYFAPVVTALNQADEVFSVLSNAIKLKDALEKDVDSLQSVLSGLKDQVSVSQKAIESNVTALAQAKAQAEKDIADAKAQADAEVKSIKAAVADRTKKSIMDAESKIAASYEMLNQAHEMYKNDMTVMSAGKASLQADVDALEAKLASLREQAKKFAASLVE
jgi:predicted  nucleic acid-binding Zn-ribbon protein